MTYSGNYRLGDLFSSRREKGRAGLPTLSVTLNDGLVNRENLDRKQDTNLAPEEHRPSLYWSHRLSKWRYFGREDNPMLRKRKGCACRRSREWYWFWKYGVSRTATKERCISETHCT